MSSSIPAALHASDPSSGAGDGSTIRLEGFILVVFAFDLGWQVDLERAAALFDGGTRPRTIRRRRRAPAWFEYDPAPLHLTITGEPITVGDRQTDADVAITVLDFGPAVITYRLPMPETLGRLPALASELYEHAALEADARAHARRLAADLADAITRPRVSDTAEDYVIHCITGWSDDRDAPAPGGPPPSARVLLERGRATLARVIEAEVTELSPEQVERSTQAAIGYGPHDLAVFDWNAALLIDPEPEDVVAVLQHANAELLALRILDAELDQLIEESDDSLARILRRPLWPSFAERRLLTRVATAQSEAAVGFEGVHNAIKLVGTQYLARLYRVAAEQLGLPDWTASVERKLAAGEGLHGRMSDAAATRRLEVLEWVIIVLIAVSIVLPFTPFY
jgi:hypothetical protein